MATTDKIITLSGLSAYNTALTAALGLGANANYTAPEGDGNAESVKAALDELYGKIKAIDADAYKGKTTLAVGDNTDLTAGDVDITLGGDGANGTTNKVTLSKITFPEISATKGEGTYIDVTLSNGTLGVDDTKLDETFLKTEDAHNEIVSIQDVTLEKGEGTTYSGTLSYTDNAGSSNTATISIDAADFIKDGFLDSVAYGNEEGNGDTLVFTWNTAAGNTVTEIDLSKYIDVYTADETTITISSDEKISAKTTTLTVSNGANKTVSAGDETSLVTGKKVADAINSAIKGNKKTLALSDTADTVMDLNDGSANEDGEVTQTLDIAIASESDVRAIINGTNA